MAAMPPVSKMVRHNWYANGTKLRFVQDWVSREGHRCQRAHFDHPFDALDPEGLGLEWVEVGGHAGVAAVLEPTRSEESGIVLVLGNTPVWLVGMVQNRACSQTEEHFDQGDQELGKHPSLVDQRTRDSAHMEDLGSVDTPAVEGVVGIQIHIEVLESVAPVRRAK